MAIWIIPTILLLTISTSLADTDEGICSCGKSAAGGEQMTCQNVTTSFFKHVQLNLTRTHWFACENCVLDKLNEEVFPHTRNNVSILHLDSARIQRLENYTFSRLPLLKFLSLKNNQIEFIGNKAFLGLNRLAKLDLSKNYLTKLETNVFMDLPSLDILNLTQNAISYIQSNVFAGLLNLKYLYLNNNQLTKLENNSFNHLTSLKLLYLENNGLAIIEPLAFNGLRFLNHLYLNNNSISELVQYNFKELPSLVELQLMQNNLSEIETSAFNGLRNIKYLHLSKNHLCNVKPYGFIGLNSLLILNLIGNNFEEFSLDYLNGMKYLSAIWLQGNNISNFTMSKSADVFQFLTVFDLLDNNIEEINYKVMYNKMPKLQQIIIGNNSWECEFIVQMSEYFLDKNVSLCTDYASCKIEDVELYVNETCAKAIKNYTVYETDTDYVAEAAVLNKFQLNSVILLVIIVFVHKTLGID